MNRRNFLRTAAAAPAAALALGAPVLAGGKPAMRGTGDLGIVIERATGSVLIVETTGRSILGRITGLGDLSHASAVYARDERYVFVFGRDGGLTKIDILEQKIVKRVIQGGNAIGGAISDDGRLVAVSNYKPGGVRIFDTDTLDMVADIPANSKTVGLVDAPGRKFVFSLYDTGEIWIADMSAGNTPELTKFTDVGELPYDGLVTGDGRHYIAGLFGQDGLVHLDLWQEPLSPKLVLENYGRGEKKLPVYKMPHLEGWALAGGKFLLPAVGRHEVLALDANSFEETGRVKVYGQPIFVMARPDGRHAWVNFALPHNDTIQVLDTVDLKVIHQFKPGPAVLHMEFTPRGHEVWMSVRDAGRIDIYDTASFKKLAELPAQSPSGIFFTARAHQIGL